MIAKGTQLASGGLNFSGTKAKTNQEMKIIVHVRSSILCFPTSKIHSLRIYIIFTSTPPLTTPLFRKPKRQRLHFVSGLQFYTELFILKAFLMVGFGGIMWPCVLKQMQ